MPRTPQSFARYMAVSTEAEAWGVAVRAGGCIINEPGEPYPPAGHPADHAFGWEHGRVLGGWQVVLVVKGEGFFDQQPVHAGEVIFLAPGRWHRYRPAVEKGWTELWVELNGEVLTRLTAKGVLPSDCRVMRPVKGRELAAAMGELHREIKESGGERPAELAALAMRVLGGLIERARENGTRLQRAVKKAERLLAEKLTDPPSMPALARQLGVNYASFRRHFARCAGMAPRQYVMRLRMERAQRMIGATPMTLDAIAEQLGFSSAFHLSAAFKRYYGIPPMRWRSGASASAPKMMRARV